jgi:hypothetical protein
MSNRNAAWLVALASLPVMVLSGCNIGGSETPAQQQQRQQALTRPDSNLPAGFDLYVGRGEVREFAVGTQGEGKIISYSIIADPRDIVQHYERQATAAGMTYAGRVDGGENLSYDFTHRGATPHSMSVNTLKKGEYTNVSLYFDVTPA